VADGTDPAFDVLNEASTNPVTFALTPASVCEQANLTGLLCCVSQVTAHYACTTCISPAAAPPPDPAVDLILRYRLRDRVFRRTAGGRRLTLYHAHSPDVARVVLAHSSLADRAVAALLAWQPSLRSLLDGTGGTATIAPEQVQALLAFLDALVPVATPAVRVAARRERVLLGVDGWAGLSIEQALARLEQVGCEASASFASVACRLEELATLVTRLVPAGTVATRLRAAAEKGEGRARDDERLRAEGKQRPARIALRKAIKAVAGLERTLRSRRGMRAVEAGVREVLESQVSGVHADLTALRS
jgi:hypothetical protein